MVELLAEGEQTVIEGPHRSGTMHYWRSGDPIENREWLRTHLVTGDDIVRAMKALSAWIAATPGLELIRASASSGGSDSAAAVRITNLMSPHLAKDRDVLARCMRAIDLDGERIDYDTFINLLRALCAAVAGDMVFFTEQVWPWVCTQKIARGNGPRSEDQGIEWLETRWHSFTDSTLGAEFIYQWAATFGCMDGNDAIARERAELAQAVFSDTETSADVQAGVAGGPAGAGAPSAGGGPVPFNDTHFSVAIDFAAAHTGRWRLPSTPENGTSSKLAPGWTTRGLWTILRR